MHDSVDHPVSLYAATKKANELMAHTYAHLYGIPSTGLRFFTVYGPWGRPDMALFLFTRAILAGEPIKIFNSGLMSRDFTYVDDAVEAILGLIDHPAVADPKWDGLRPDPGASFAPYKIYNIGNNKPVELLEFVSVIEDCLQMKAQKGISSHAARRCPDNLCGYQGHCQRFRLPPSDPPAPGDIEFHSLVQAILWEPHEQRLEAQIFGRNHLRTETRLTRNSRPKHSRVAGDRNPRTFGGRA